MSKLPALGGLRFKSAEAYILPPKNKATKQKSPKVRPMEESKSERAKELFKQAAVEELQKFAQTLQQLNIK